MAMMENKDTIERKKERVLYIRQQLKVRNSCSQVDSNITNSHLVSSSSTSLGTNFAPQSTESEDDGMYL